MTQLVAIPKSSTVYLAGGFRSGWQDHVIAALPSLIFADPRSHNFADTKQYTEWDLNAVAEANVVFAYMEKSNPAGYALALEIGYAKATGKHIILVDTKSIDDEQFKRYWGMCRACADVIFDNLSEGIKYLQDQILA